MSGIGKIGAQVVKSGVNAAKKGLGGTPVWKAGYKAQANGMNKLAQIDPQYGEYIAKRYHLTPGQKVTAQQVESKTKAAARLFGIPIEKMCTKSGKPANINKKLLDKFLKADGLQKNASVADFLKAMFDRAKEISKESGTNFLA